MIKYFLIILFCSTIIFSQQKGERIKVVGDSLVGRMENGERIRDVMGNVEMTQGNVNITCERAIQNITRNNAVLINNVVVTRDTIEILTERAYYFGDAEYTYSDTSISLDDGHVVLKADTGYYYFDLDKAVFNSNVQLVDSVNILNSNKLTYMNKTSKAIAVGNVEITNLESSIFSDSLIHFRDIKHSEAFSNVVISDPDKDLFITGDYLIDDGEQKYTRITGDPLLRKIDTTSTGEFDTLYIKSLVLESVVDSVNKLIATDSVKIIRDEFFSVNNVSILFRDQDKILTYKNVNDNIPPILWYQNSQVIGDTIMIYLDKNQLDWIDIRNEATIISQNPDYEFRFDQITGDQINLYFSEDGLSQTDVLENVLSIYYLYEDGKPNGLLKSSSQRAKMFFKDNNVTDVRLFQNVESEYHPENLVGGKEKDFTLPTFVLYENKPDLIKILKESK